MQKILESKAVIRFQDCDPYGQLNNARYIDYFINAREDQVLEAYDLNIYQRAQTKGLAWVVSQNQLAYLQPATMMEHVTISSKVVSLDSRSMTVEFQMLSSANKQLKTIMWSRFVHYDLKTRKSTPHEEELMSRFANVVVAIDEDSFDARVRALRTAAMG